MTETEGFNKGYRWGNALSVESSGLELDILFCYNCYYLFKQASLIFD